MNAVASGKNLLAISLMIVPFILAVVYERSGIQKGPAISSLAIATPKFHGNDADASLVSDFEQRLTKQLSAIPGLQLKTGDGPDLLKLGKDLGVDAVLAASITEDDGVIQIAVKVIDAHTGEVIWDKPYEGRRDHYTEIASAVGDTLRENLQLK